MWVYITGKENSRSISGCSLKIFKAFFLFLESDFNLLRLDIDAWKGG